MSIFHLPDLGEGLPDAQIHEWHVKEGDFIETDTVLISMETAKAVVEVPAPFSGKVIKCCGQVGDVLDTGDPLVEYEVVGQIKDKPAEPETETKTTTSTNQTMASSQVGAQKRDTTLIRTLPMVRVLASQLNVDLATIKGTGQDGLITPEDVKRAANITTDPTIAKKPSVPAGFEPMKGVRRTMAQAMALSHSQICPVTLFDDADLTHWEAGNDITIRVIRAIVQACKQEPALNAWFDGDSLSRQCHDNVNLGIAMDSDAGLFVPVLHHVNSLSAGDIRQQINQFKADVKSRKIAPNSLRDPTITLSNFGVFAGRYATPIVVPPTVAIIATGCIHTTLQYNADKTIYQQRLLPLSLTVDHRACTGGETARFLKAVLEDLVKPN